MADRLTESNIPFIKKFKTADNYYIYDVHTNEILKVDELTFELAEHWGKFPSRDIIKKFQGRYSLERIEKSLEHSHKANSQEGLFLTTRPEKLQVPWSTDDIKKHLDTSLEQLILNITEDCNLRCKYCVYSGIYKHQRVHSKKFMDWPKAKKAIDFFLNRVKETKEIAVGFYGGEPLLNFQLIKKCVPYIKNRTKNKNLHITITTNGTVLTKESSEFIVKNKIILLISLDGPADIHDRFRQFKNGKGTFNAIKQNLIRLRNLDSSWYRLFISFNAVLSPPYSVAEIDRFYNHDILFKNNKVQLSDIDNLDTDFFDQFDPSSVKYDEMEEMKNRFVQICVNDGRPKDVFLRALFERGLIKIHQREPSKSLPKTFYPNGICLPGGRRLYVGVDGTFSMCERVNTDIKIGDINQGFDYEKIHYLVSKYSEMSSEDCCNCWCIRFCPSCFSQATGKELDIDRKREFCGTVKSGTEQDFVMYSRILEKNPKALDYIKDITFI